MHIIAYMEKSFCFISMNYYNYTIIYEILLYNNPIIQCSTFRDYNYLIQMQ